MYSEKGLEVQRSMTNIPGSVWLCRERINSLNRLEKIMKTCNGFIDWYECHRKVTKECLATNFRKVRSRDIKGKY